MRVALLAWVQTPLPPYILIFFRLFIAISYFVGTFLLPVYMYRKI